MIIYIRVEWNKMKQDFKNSEMKSNNETGNWKNQER